MGETRGPKNLSFLLRGGVVLRPCSGSAVEFCESWMDEGEGTERKQMRKLTREWEWGGGEREREREMKQNRRWERESR